MKAPFICSGLVVTSAGIAPGSVVINRQTSLITSIEAYTVKADIVGSNLVILPGNVDIHVHARQCPSGEQDEKETFETACAAAINGGVTAIATMPNLPVPPTNDALYYNLLELALGQPIDIVPYHAIAPGSRPLQRFVPGKAFAAESVNDLKFTSRTQLEETLCHFGPGQCVSIHCDDNDILAAAAGEILHEDRRPAESEIAAIAFVLELSKKYGFSLKIVHVSTRRGLELIATAKREGMDVMCECTPHHCFFDRTMITEENRQWRRMNPPLRTPDDRLGILDGLQFGDIDVLATDHAPHLKSQRNMSGLPLLDTWGAFITWLVRKKGFDWRTIARIASTTPGAWLNQFLRRREAPNIGLGYGRIAPGYIGSLTILDMDTPTLVTEEMLRTKCGWSPFTGMTFPGSVSATIVRGEPLKRDGVMQF